MGPVNTYLPIIKYYGHIANPPVIGEAEGPFALSQLGAAGAIAEAATKGDHAYDFP